jgi:hypothetical protein
MKYESPHQNAIDAALTPEKSVATTEKATRKTFRKKNVLRTVQ